MNNANLLTIKSLMKQQQELQLRSPVGVKIISNSEDPLDIQADILGPQATPYENGIFRIKLVIPNEFPHSPPKGYFMTKIFHPNVSAKGEICVNTLKKDWNPKNWSLYHIFEVIKCLLIVPFPESSLNEEAGKLFMENYQEYSKLAKLYTNIYSIEGNRSKAQMSTKSNDICLSEASEIENKRVILTNDSIINNENNILIQRNTNEIEKSLGKKLTKPLPISINELINFKSENKSGLNNLDKKEHKTNLRTFELLRTTSKNSPQSIVAININNNVTLNDVNEFKNCKKEDMKKWISRI